jgi:hypothetical protein
MSGYSEETEVRVSLFEIIASLASVCIHYGTPKNVCVGSTRGNVTPNLLRNAKVHLFGKQTFIFTVYPAKVQLFSSDGSKMDPAAENRCTFTFGVQGEAEFKQNRCTFAG